MSFNTDCFIFLFLVSSFRAVFGVRVSFYYLYSGFLVYTFEFFIFDNRCDGLKF